MVETVLITIDAFDIPQVKPFLARRAWIPGPRRQPGGPGRSTRPRAVDLVPEERRAGPAGHPDPPRHLGAAGPGQGADRRRDRRRRPPRHRQVRARLVDTGRSGRQPRRRRHDDEPRLTGRSTKAWQRMSVEGLET